MKLRTVLEHALMTPQKVTFSMQLAEAGQPERIPAGRALTLGNSETQDSGASSGNRHILCLFITLKFREEMNIKLLQY